MATTATKRKKKPEVSGKAAISSSIRYEIKVDAKQRYNERGFDEASSWGKVQLIVEQVEDQIRIQPADCETQIATTLPTLRALMVELEKKIEVK
jgi:hypothetical protein